MANVQQLINKQTQYVNNVIPIYMEKAILLRVVIYLICYFECNCNESFSHDTNNALNHVWRKQEKDVVGSHLQSLPDLLYSKHSDYVKYLS
jgi:hypothetical protein